MGLMDTADAKLVALMESEQGKKITETTKWVFLGEVLVGLTFLNPYFWILASVPLVWVIALVAKKYFYKKEASATV